MDNQDITKPKINKKLLYQHYLEENNERKLTGNSYVNTEFEMWSNLKPGGLVPLKDQRKPFEKYFPQNQGDLAYILQAPTNYHVSGKWIYFL